MGASGTAIVDFGAFPGRSDASFTVSAPGIAANSLVEAWILPVVTTDHSPDEHEVETLTCKAYQSSIVANVSFTICLANTSQLSEQASSGGSQGSALGGIGTLIYGKWNVGWVWD
jgi:hypothetical protein